MFGPVFEVLVSDQNGSSGRPVDRSEDMKKCTFARPGFSRQRNQLPRPDLQGNSFQDRHFPRSHRIAFLQVACDDRKPPDHSYLKDWIGSSRAALEEG